MGGGEASSLLLLWEAIHDDIKVAPGPSTSLTATKRVCLIRHGQGAHNASIKNWKLIDPPLNEVGLACDEQHLNSSAYPPPSGNASEDLSIHRFCEWAAGNFASVADVAQSVALHFLALLVVTTCESIHSSIL